MLKICEYCGNTEEDGRVSFSTKYGGYLCGKHYQQYTSYGVFRRTKYDKNEIILDEKNNTARIMTYKFKEGFWVDNLELIVDIDDLNMIKKYKWTVTNVGYGVTTKNKKIILLHHLIMNDLTSNIYDHKNKNPLDNRKENLRLSNKSTNAMNSKVRANNTSEIIGVSWSKERCKWEAYITLECNRKNLGRFLNKTEAIKRRLKAEKEHFGEFAPQRHLYAEYGID